MKWSLCQLERKLKFENLRGLPEWGTGPEGTICVFLLLITKLQASRKSALAILKLPTYEKFLSSSVLGLSTSEYGPFLENRI